MAYYLPQTPVLRSLARVSKESCVFPHGISHRFPKQRTFRDETESHSASKPDPGLALDRPQLGQGRRKTQGSLPSSEDSRKVQCQSLHSGPQPFYSPQYLSSFLTCSLSPSAGNYSVILSPDSPHPYKFKSVLFELHQKTALASPRGPSCSPRGGEGEVKGETCKTSWSNDN